MLTTKKAYELGRKHGAEMARESGSDNPGCDGWDGMLVNADPNFVAREFGWTGCDSSKAACDRLAAYVRGCQDAATEVVSAT